MTTAAASDPVLPAQEPPQKDATFVPLPPPKAFQPSLRYPANRKTIYDRNLSRPGASTSLASFAFVFNVLVNYTHANSASVAEIENRLNRLGYPIGIKMLDLLLARQPTRSLARPTRVLDLLQFIQGTAFRALFGRPADALEQNTTKKNEYMIIDNEPVVNTYISTPKEISTLNCAAFVAGIIEGICDAANFTTHGVSAHSSGEGDEMWPGKTIFLLRFTESVLEREEALKAG